MNLKNLLDGKWEFVGSEKHNGSKWVTSDSYVAGMTWEFQTHLIGIKKRIGILTESRPTKKEIKLNYAYDHEAKTIKIDTEIADMEITVDDEQADIYDVITSAENLNIIKLSILNDEGCPPPYFRYILQRID